MTEANQAAAAKREMRVEREIEIAAPVEEVWKALTDSKELARWFPLEARVTPGPGGKLFLSWGPGCEGETEIVAWEPGKKLATKDQFALVEWTLESRGGKTIVRLLQSGFLGNEDWEKEWFDSTSYGWQFMLLSLKVALERHRWIPRQLAWPRLKVTQTREEAYAKLLQAGALFVRDAKSALQAGAEYALQTVTGQNFSGRVEFLVEPRGFCLTVREMNDALLWLTIEGAPGNTEVQLWLSAFAIASTQIESFSREWEHRLREIFPVP
jgi:uncharacterized protein YndB with AHSA1/START domain